MSCGPLTKQKKWRSKRRERSVFERGHNFKEKAVAWSFHVMRRWPSSCVCVCVLRAFTCVSRQLAAQEGPPRGPRGPSPSRAPMACGCCCGETERKDKVSQTSQTVVRAWSILQSYFRCPYSSNTKDVYLTCPWHPNCRPAPRSTRPSSTMNEDNKKQKNTHRNNGMAYKKKKT